jgi:translation elongation factor EF-G
MSLEITKIRASVPQLIEGEVMQRLNLLGGQITLIEREGDSRTAIGSTVPKKHMAEVKIWLHTFSNGEGMFEEDHT